MHLDPRFIADARNAPIPAPERIAATRERRIESVLWEGLILTGIVALVCSFAALLGHAGCGSTDSSFTLGDPGAQPSAFCRATHFPGLPDTLGSWALVAAVYLTPAVIAATGTIAAVATGERRFLRVGIGIAAGLTLAALIASISLAHVSYAGVG